jgi:pantoate kinase
MVKFAKKLAQRKQSPKGRNFAQSGHPALGSVLKMAEVARISGRHF